MFYKDTTTTTSSVIMSEFPLNSPTTGLLTPQTVKSIEQSILASLEETTSNPQIIASAATGSFLPPLPSQPQLILANNWQGVNIQYNQEESENDSMSTEEEPVARRQIKRKPVKKQIKTKRGGRHGEEDERRVIRRERNKLAAARCRKRRVDHTMALQEETDSLETRRSTLQSQIQLYQQKKEEFEFILQSHLPTCQFHSEKKYTPVTMATTPVTIATSKPTRPTSLLVSTVANNSLPTNSTPSNGLTFENIDWGLSGCGLTPSGMTPVGGVGLVTPLITPSTVRDILSGLGGDSNNKGKFVSL